MAIGSGATLLFSASGRTVTLGVGPGTIDGTTAWSSGLTTVGRYGVDTAAGSVWVVNAHNSQSVAVPEPTDGLLAGAGLAVAAGAVSRRLARRRFPATLRA